MGGVESTEFYSAKGNTACDFAEFYTRREGFVNPRLRHEAVDPEAKRLNSNLETITETIQAIAVNRIKELDEGADPQETIADAAIGLLKDGTVKSAEELVHHAYALLLGGNENVACALVALIYHILKNPAVGDRMRREAVEAFMEGDESKREALAENLDTESVGELEYSTWAVKEALRMNSPNFGKSLVPEEKLKLGDLLVHPGTHIWLHSQVHSYSADVWPNPTEF